MRNDFFISLVLCCLCCVSSAFAQQETPTEGRILFVDTAEKGKTYLASMLPDGTDKKRLTPGYNNMVFPRHCAATGWIGFTNKLPNMTSEVYLLSRDGKKIKKIFENAALECFSPDGKSLLYTTCDKQAALYAYVIDEKTSVKISDSLRIISADWAPKGDWIAVSAMEANGNGDLYLISTRAQGIIRLTQTTAVSETFPVFSADGKYLAFISNRHDSEYQEIEYLDIEKRSLQRPIIKGLYPSLSPSNTWVTFEAGDSVGISRADGLHGRSVSKGRSPFWMK